MKNTYYFGATPEDNSVPAKIISPIVQPDGSKLARPSFPDQDSFYLAVNGVPRVNRTTPRYQRMQVSDGRGFCLSGCTDWDDLIVIVDGDEAKSWRLTPGELIRTPIKKSIEVRAPILVPSQRTASVRGRDTAGNTLAFPGSQKWTVVNGPDRIRNDGTDPVQVYQWDGGKWVAQGVIAVGAYVSYNEGGNQNVSVSAQTVLSGGSNSHRAGDWSPDARWTFADYWNAGVMAGASTGPYASAFSVDANQNPGDNSAGPAAWPNIFRAYIATDPSDHLAIYYGRAAIDVWENEDPPCDFHPRLPADRVLVMQALTVLASPNADTPDQPRLLVPSLNTEWAQLTWFCTVGAAAGSCALLGSPLPIHDVTVVAPITSPVQTADAGKGAAVAFLPNGHPWLQAAFGSRSAVNPTLIQQAVLTLRRRFVG